MSTNKIIEYINDELYNRCQPIIFTDLMNKFHIGSSNAKQIMYNYYKETTTMKFNCLIMVCFKDRTIKIVTDLNESCVQNQSDIVDCFIYAFNPNKEFIPVYELRDQTGSNLVVNPYKLVVEHRNEVESVDVSIKRSQTDSIVGGVKKNIGSRSFRSKTVPSNSSISKDRHDKSTTKPKNSMGLKSTELLTKMRKAREEREAERQRQLKQRRQEEEANRLKRLNSDPTRKAQMEDLNKLFVDSDEDEETNINKNNDKNTEESHNKHEVEEADMITTSTTTTKIGKTINDSELESLLDTTAEESLLEIKKEETIHSTQKDTMINSKPDIEPTDSLEIPENKNKEKGKKDPLGDESIEEIITSYVDEDGYIVTNRKRPLSSDITTNNNNKQKGAEQRNTPQKMSSKSKSILSSFRSASKKGSQPPRKKVKQGSIESFFKRS